MAINHYEFGSLESAHQLFNIMPRRNAVSWNAMMTTYAQVGYGEKTLHIFRETFLARMKIDWVTFVSVLSSCAHLATLKWGRQVNVHTIRSELKSKKEAT